MILFKKGIPIFKINEVSRSLSGCVGIVTEMCQPFRNRTNKNTINGSIVILLTCTEQGAFKFKIHTFTKGL